MFWGYSERDWRVRALSGQNRSSKTPTPPPPRVEELSSLFFFFLLDRRNGEVFLWIGREEGEG